jgi:SHAQKYF class myb-like DNA-binding protein
MKNMLSDIYEHVLYVEATPKRILQTMSVRELKISHIKSHLQVYFSYIFIAHKNL